MCIRDRIQFGGRATHAGDGGDDDDDGRGWDGRAEACAPVELKLLMTDERVAQGELVVERIRAFLKHEASVLAGREHRHSSARRAASPRGGELPFFQPPMRV